MLGGHLSRRRWPLILPSQVLVVRFRFVAQSVPFWEGNFVQQQRFAADSPAFWNYFAEICREGFTG